PAAAQAEPSSAGSDRLLSPAAGGLCFAGHCRRVAETGTLVHDRRRRASVAGLSTVLPKGRDHVGTLLITGSSGLIGSQAVEYFDQLGWSVHGVDNNMRREFFGRDGDTDWNRQRLQAVTRRFVHHEVDIRNRAAILKLLEQVRVVFVIHAAAQPSHDLAASRPFDDFDVNAVGTMNLLEA